MELKKRKWWMVCVILMIILTVIGYTPLVIPNGVYKPMILGIPYSLWASGLITVLLVALTYIGAKVHPGTDEGEEES